MKEKTGPVYVEEVIYVNEQVHSLDVKEYRDLKHYSETLKDFIKLFLHRASFIDGLYVNFDVSLDGSMNAKISGMYDGDFRRIESRIISPKSHFRGNPDAKN